MPKALHASLLLVLTLTLMFALASTVTAQGLGSGTSTSGLFGSRTLGQGISAGQTGGGTPGSRTTQDISDAGSISGSERFIQDNRQGQFVGSDTGELANVRSQAGAGRQGGNPLQGLESLVNQFGSQNPNQGQGGATNSRRAIRAPLRIGFELVGSANVSVDFTNRLERIPQMRSAGDINVRMIGRTAVLTGTVDSESSRTLAESLARLEPGISAVRNELTVGTPQ